MYLFPFVKIKKNYLCVLKHLNSFISLKKIIVLLYKLTDILKLIFALRIHT